MRTVRCIRPRKKRNNFQFYCNNLNAAVNVRLNLEGEQRHAVGREDFKVFYQPQIDLRAGEIIGAEVLVRWQLPQRRLLLPEEFLPAVMDTGLVRAIDEWVPPTACRHSQAWQQRGKMPVRISVNISTCCSMAIRCCLSWNRRSVRRA